MVARKSRFKALLGTEVAIVEFIPEELVQPVLLFLTCRTAWSHGKDTVCDLGSTPLDSLLLEDVRPEEGLRDSLKASATVRETGHSLWSKLYQAHLWWNESGGSFHVWQPFKVPFKIWTPVIHWNNHCSVMCSNKLCLVDPSTRGFHHVSKFVNWRDVVLLVQFLYDAKTSIRGKLRVASNQKRISNWKMELENCPPS